MKSIVLTAFDHQARLVVEAIQILSEVNETSDGERKPFALIGEHESKEFWSCWGSSRQSKGIVGDSK